MSHPEPGSPHPSGAPIGDALAVLVVSLAICLAAHRLIFMTVFVPAVIALRTLGWARLHRRAHLGTEIAFLTLCTLLGAFNDWTSVVRKGIYDYTVPVFFPSFGTIPIWMLLSWGLILRFLASLAAWDGLGPTSASRAGDLIPPRVRSPVFRVSLLVLLVVLTRQAIYRWYLDPILSWLPFFGAILLYPFLFGVTRRELRLAALLLVGGPLVEISYIQLGGLHRYHLGWLGGVPLWIVLWWVLGIVVWADLAPRLGRVVARVLERRPHPIPVT